MTDEDGVRIRDFLERNSNIQSIIVHCDAGQSRSAGVAAAILKAKTGSDMQIFKRAFYKPNMHCYRITLNHITKTHGGIKNEEKERYKRSVRHH